MSNELQRQRKNILAKPHKLKDIHALSYHDDPVIQRRLQIQSQLLVRHYAEQDILKVVNADIEHNFPGEKPISLSTLRTDKMKIKERWREHAQQGILDAFAEAIEECNDTINLAMQAYSSTAANSLNRSAYLAIKQKAVMDKARLKGLFQPDLTMIKQQTMNIDHMDVLVEAALQMVPNKQTIMDMLDQLPTRVIDTTAVHIESASE